MNMTIRILMPGILMLAMAGATAAGDRASPEQAMVQAIPGEAGEPAGRARLETPQSLSRPQPEQRHRGGTNSR